MAVNYRDQFAGIETIDLNGEPFAIPDVLNAEAAYSLAIMEYQSEHPDAPYGELDYFWFKDWLRPSAKGDILSTFDEYEIVLEVFGLETGNLGWKRKYWFDIELVYMDANQGKQTVAQAIDLHRQRVGDTVYLEARESSNSTIDMESQMVQFSWGAGAHLRPGEYYFDITFLHSQNCSTPVTEAEPFRCWPATTALPLPHRLQKTNSPTFTIRGSSSIEGQRGGNTALIGGAVGGALGGLLLVGIAIGIFLWKRYDGKAWLDARSRAELENREIEKQDEHEPVAELSGNGRLELDGEDQFREMSGGDRADTEAGGVEKWIAR
ncbi:hypothetical protein BJ508DRAFT_367621 [Ascobolus immersus RN42]|uniref:Uncharacterized protein n=1 Tax=Ascobolus immersus RN42 TaxID=1160509 RepID=A0A3N4HIA3_ASCIM|nr:hypothetical protein BJ508DRAFT_367621 [Ascobolus immersus RN42]